VRLPAARSTSARPTLAEWQPQLVGSCSGLRRRSQRRWKQGNRRDELPLRPEPEEPMTRYKTWVLTDAASNVRLDRFRVANDALRLATPHDWSLSKHTLRGGLRDGVDLIEVHNGALAFSVLPSRGMGLWRGEFRGNFLGWRSPVAGPVHPKFV